MLDLIFALGPSQAQEAQVWQVWRDIVEFLEERFLPLGPPRSGPLLEKAEAKVTHGPPSPSIYRPIRPLLHRSQE